MNKVNLIIAVLLGTATVACAGGIEQGVAEALAIVQKRGLKVDEVLVRQSVIRAIARASDPNAEVFDPAQAIRMRERLAGTQGAPGFRLGITNGQPVVLEVTPGGPAAKAGVKTGDVIIGLSGADEYEVLDLPAALAATRGDAGQTLDLQLRRGTTSTGVTVTLAAQQLPVVELAERLPNSFLYIKVNGLYAGGGPAISTELQNWAAKNKGGIILDLRGAGGDDLDGVGKVAGLFVKSGETLLVRDDGGDQGRASVVADAGAKPLALPLMVLVDAATRGASEVLAAALAGSVKGAMLVGETTAADPMIREFIKLESGDELFIATRKIHAGSVVYDGRTGVKPDVAVNVGRAFSEYEAEPAAEHRRALLDQELQDYALRNRIKGDPVLRRAVDILLGLKALNIGAGGLPGGG